VDNVLTFGHSFPPVTECPYCKRQVWISVVDFGRSTALSCGTVISEKARVLAAGHDPLSFLPTWKERLAYIDSPSSGFEVCPEGRAFFDRCVILADEEYHVRLWLGVCPDLLAEEVPQAAKDARALEKRVKELEGSMETVIRRAVQEAKRSYRATNRWRF